MATVFAVDYDDELECPLCLDAWKKPVEASPCGHIFCEECFPQKAKSCPVCRQEIKSTQQPHRSLVNMASNVTVKCQRCGWTGTREVGYSHKCSGPKTPVETGGRVPASAPSNKHLTTYSNYEYDYDYYLSESAPISYTNASHQNNSSSFHAENMAPLKRPSLSDGEPWRKYGLDKKDYEQLSKQFTFFLEGGSTSLNRPQLTKLLRWMNFAHKPQVIADIFAEMDDDGNGLLDINEFLTWVGKNQPPPDRLYGFSLATYGKIMMEFNMFDLDEDGLLNVEDFTDMMVSTGQEKDLDRIAAIFRNLDNNNYGLISLNDYLAFRKDMSVCIGENVNDELVCGVCLDSFNDPVEIRRCGHIYCRKCLTGMKDCPTCREPIESTVAPNRAIVNMALNVQVKCMKCGWKGTRESSNKHVCSSKTKKEAQAAAAPPVQPAQPAPSMNRPPPSNAAPSPAPYTYNFDQFQGYPGAAQAPAPAPTGLYYNGQPTPQPNQAPPQIQSNRRYEVIEPVGNYPWNLYGLTQEEYDQIVSIFVFFDADDSGTLDRQEVSRLAHWLNFARTEAEVNRIFMDMDADGSGSLSQGEFLTWLKYNKPNPKALYGLNQKQYNTIMMQFHGYDRNQDGCLEFEEFAQLVLNLGDVSSREAAMKLFGMIDRQRKGSIDLHQFLTFRAGKVV